MKHTMALCVFCVVGFAAATGACTQHFSYNAGSSSWTYVLVAGTFNDWNNSPDTGWHLRDDDGDRVWQADFDLNMGPYEYKFVCADAGGNQNWIFDEANPLKVDDGYSGWNSVILVDCRGSFTVGSFVKDDQARTATATLSYVPGEWDLDPASVAAKLDHETLVDAQTAGNTVTINVTGLTDGIHDIRVTATDTSGQPVRDRLLKVLINRPEDWRRDTLYFALTDRFNNGDTNNDAPIPDVPFQTNYQGGDLPGILDKLEDGYFQQLGVTALWISWPGDNVDHGEWAYWYNTRDCDVQYGEGYPEEWLQFSAYHGYWPTNLREPEEHFGSMDDLQALVNAAHRQGIRVLLDLVINHVHLESPYYSSHPDSYWNLPAEICQEIYWERPITCWFTSYLPDLDYLHPGAVWDMLDLATWWAKQAGADGFRVDAVKHVELGFVQALRQHMQEEFEQTGVKFYLVGETFSGNPDDISYFLGDDLLHGQFDFPLNLHLLKGFATDEEGLSDLHNNFREFRQNYRRAYPEFLMSNFLGNHDIARFITLAAGQLWCPVWDNNSHVSQGWIEPPARPNAESAYQRLRLAFTYLMTIPGIPLIYYGDEFGLPGANDPDNRRMMYFTGLTQWEQDTLDYLRLLGQFRQEYPVLSIGEFTAMLAGDADMLAFGRTLGEDVALIAINRATSTQLADVQAASLGLENGDVLTDLLSHESVTVSNGRIRLQLAGRTAAIFMAETLPPTPTPTPSLTPTPSNSPTPTNTATPAGCDTLGVTIRMPNSMFFAGSSCSLDVEVCNNTPSTLSGYPLFVILEVAGMYWFADGWTQDMDYYHRLFDPGVSEFQAIPYFNWPGNAGSGNATFYGALTNAEITDIYGAYDSWEFSWR